MKSKSLFFAFTFLFIATTSIAQVTDIDGHQYKTVKIGTQVWMAENLNVSHFQNGDPIPESKDWVVSEDGKPAWCYYNNDVTNGNKYGRLYNWYVVNAKRGLAPKGWHIPTEGEWKILINYLGGNNVACSKLKTTNGWLKSTYAKAGINNGNGTNESGFTGLPAGLRADDLEFSALGYNFYFWSASAATSSAWSCTMDFSDCRIELTNDLFQRDGLSIRCVKD
ncbi:MAG TPA: fibrobacter succinogenes major paralogous domain-containing protein [Ginsengibacter sp.]